MYFGPYMYKCSADVTPNPVHRPLSSENSLSRLLQYKNYSLQFYSFLAVTEETVSIPSGVDVCHVSVRRHGPVQYPPL